jgi:hypothetical protein
MHTTHGSALGQDLLANMARIPVIIPGKLSERKDPRGKINGWKLQRWHNGHNETRYISAEQVATVREGTAGHQQFVALTQEYIEVKGREALSTLNTPSDSKRKPMKR